jgi:peptidyl-dipeptidase A
MLKLGQSKPWPEAMKIMTGEDKADASAILEYFQPLVAWLKAQNQGQNLGWTPEKNPQSAK